MHSPAHVFYTLAQIHSLTHKYTHSQIHTRMWTHTQLQACAYMYIYVCICISMCVCDVGFCACVYVCAVCACTNVCVHVLRGSVCAHKSCTPMYYMRVHAWVHVYMLVSDHMYMCECMRRCVSRLCGSECMCVWLRVCRCTTGVYGSCVSVLRVNVWVHMCVVQRVCVHVWGKVLYVCTWICVSACVGACVYMGVCARDHIGWWNNLHCGKNRTNSNKTIAVIKWHSCFWRN